MINEQQESRSIAESLAEAASFLNAAQQVLLVWHEQATTEQRVQAEEARRWAQRILDLQKRLEQKASELERG